MALDNYGLPVMPTVNSYMGQLSGSNDTLFNGGIFGGGVNGASGSTGIGFQPGGLGGTSGGIFGNSGLGLNMGTAQMGLAGIGALGGIWNAMQAQGLAKKQFDFSKRIAETNLQNQTQAYNTTLEDRTRSRYVQENRGSGEADDYLARHRLASR